MFWQQPGLAVPKRELSRHHGPKNGQDWQLGRLEMARLADAGCSRHTTLLRKILAPRVLTGIGVASPYPDLLGGHQSCRQRERWHQSGVELPWLMSAFCFCFFS